MPSTNRIKKYTGNNIDDYEAASKKTDICIRTVKQMFSNTFRSYKSDPSKTKREGVISGKAVFRNKHHWLPKEGKNRVNSPYRNSWVMNLGGLSKD